MLPGGKMLFSEIFESKTTATGHLLDEGNKV